MTNPDRPRQAPMLIIVHPRDEWFLERLPCQVDLDPELVEMDRSYRTLEQKVKGNVVWPRHAAGYRAGRELAPLRRIGDASD